MKMKRAVWIINNKVIKTFVKVLKGISESLLLSFYYYVTIIIIITANTWKQLGEVTDTIV